MSNVNVSLANSDKKEIISDVIEILDQEILMTALSIGVDPTEIDDNWSSSSFSDEKKRFADRIIEKRLKMKELTALLASLS